MATRSNLSLSAIPAGMRAKPATIPLQKSRPSTTRSDALSGPLHDAGLGIPRLVAELEAMLSASMIVKKLVKIADGDWRQQDFEIPDWRTRTKAVELLQVIHGYQYAPQKAQDQHPIVLILNQLPDETRQAVEQSIENRLKGLLKPGIN
jgi:hypothetical protein